MNRTMAKVWAALLLATAACTPEQEGDVQHSDEAPVHAPAAPAVTDTTPAPDTSHSVPGL
jgi:hypothetical protein